MSATACAPLLAMILFSLSALSAGEPSPSVAELPPGGGILNVRDPAYGAVGDGVADDTAAIQKALSEALDSHQVVYLPKGTYLVSETLRWWREGYNLGQVNGWGAFLQLQGQGRKDTIIKLKDNAAGFTDAATTKPVIATGSRGYHGNKGYRNGEGNEAFENHLRDFTLDVGAGNAGAVGIDYQVSNCGAIRNVTIRASDAKTGAIGIDLCRRDNGPGMIADVLIEGFAIGLRTSQELAHINVKNLGLRNQREVGIRNQDAILTVNGVISDNAVPVASNGGVGLLTLFGCQANGSGAVGFALKNEGEATLLIRDLTMKGYKAVIDAKPQPLAGPKVAFWSSSVPVGGTHADAGKLVLAMEQPAAFTIPGLKLWAWVAQPNGNDDTVAIQAALDAGKPVVALGAGRWFISKPLTVPASVRLITGLGAELDTKNGQWKGDDACFRMVGGKASDQTMVERFSIGGTCPLIVDHVDVRTVVLRDLLFFGGEPYRNVNGSKKLFIDNVAGNGYQFGPGTKVWADQFDIEGDHNNRFDKAQVLVLGFKHEGGHHVLRATNSTVQMFGGLLYTFGGINADNPAVSYLDGKASMLSLVNVTYVGNGTFPVPLVAGPAASPTTIRSDTLPRRNGGYALPLWLGK